MFYIQNKQSLWEAKENSIAYHWELEWEDLFALEEVEYSFLDYLKFRAYNSIGRVADF